MSVSQFYGRLAPQARIMARLELANWLLKQGQFKLAKCVCNSSTDSALKPHMPEVEYLAVSCKPEEIFRYAAFFRPDMMVSNLNAPKTTLDLLRSDVVSVRGSVELASSGVCAKIEGAKLINAIDRALASSDDNDDIIRARLEGVLFESRGYLAGISGQQSLDSTLITDEIDRDEFNLDPWIYCAQLFTDAVRSGILDIAGHTVGHEWVYKGFVDSAFEMLSIGEDCPLFIKTMGGYWAHVQGVPAGDSSTEIYTQGIGNGFGRYARSQMLLGLHSGVPKYLMKYKNHLIDIAMLIRGRGWMRGVADAHMGDEGWGKILSGNISTVIGFAMSRADIDYIAKVVAQLPEMVKAIDEEVARLEITGPEGMDIAKALRRRRAGIVYWALRSGGLLSYVRKEMAR